MHRESRALRSKMLMIWIGRVYRWGNQHLCFLKSRVSTSNPVPVVIYKFFPVGLADHGIWQREGRCVNVK